MKKFIGSMIIVRFFISVESLRLNFYRDESFYRSFLGSSTNSVGESNVTPN